MILKESSDFFVHRSSEPSSGRMLKCVFVLCSTWLWGPSRGDSVTLSSSLIGCCSRCWAMIGWKVASAECRRQWWCRGPAVSSSPTIQHHTLNTSVTSVNSQQTILTLENIIWWQKSVICSLFCVRDKFSVWINHCHPRDLKWRWKIFFFLKNSDRWIKSTFYKMKIFFFYFLLLKVADCECCVELTELCRVVRAESAASTHLTRHTHTEWKIVVSQSVRWYLATFLHYHHCSETRHQWQHCWHPSSTPPPHLRLWQLENATDLCDFVTGL